MSPSPAAQPPRRRQRHSLSAPSDCYRIFTISFRSYPFLDDIKDKKFFFSSESKYFCSEITAENFVRRMILIYFMAEI